MSQKSRKGEATKARARTQRREVERALRRDVRQRERLAAAAPGGSETQPLVVASAALVESTARSQRCPQCGGELDLQRDGVGARPERRWVEVSCRLCHARRVLHFELRAPVVN